MYNIYVGWDSREDIAYQVCEHSIRRRTRRNNISIIPLKQNDLREQKLYWRAKDKLSSTEFTITRFLVPYLNNLKLKQNLILSMKKILGKIFERCL